MIRFQRHSLILLLFIVACLTPIFLAHAQNLIGATPAAAPPCTMCAQSETIALHKLLKSYQEIAAGGGWPQWQLGKEVRQNASDVRIPNLRLMLTITEDYKPIAGNPAASQRYDAALIEAVKHFQLRHGLNGDGRLGKSTQLALSIPVEKRLSQIMNTLTRMQGEQAFEHKFILVNLPAYTLYAVDKDNVALSMRVIVGNRQNHTPLFDNVVTDVVFNPPWSVPARIARNELIPKLRENPSYFVNAGFVVSQDGEPVDPMTINPDSEDYSFRQRPGAGNALGKIKFNIPDSDNIYLHSTAAPKLFAQEDRALSHGCVRLEKPRDLAHFVMNDDKGWDTTRIDHAYDSSTQRSVRVNQVPVHLVYWTAFVDAQGTPYFYNDVYNKDASVTARLNDTGAYQVAAQ